MARKKKAVESLEKPGLPSGADLDADAAEKKAIEATKPTVITLATEREAQQITEGLINAYRSFTAAWWELGKRVKEALDRQVPAALEMDAHTWMTKIFGETASVAKIHRSLRIARALEKLPEEQVKQLTEGKAYLLTQLKPEDREEYLGTALNVSNDEFEEMVEARREEYGFKSEGKKVHVSVSLERSQAEQWEECEKKVARILELDIELKPGLRAQVFEAIAATINTTPDEVLTAEMVGGEEAA